MTYLIQLPCDTLKVDRTFIGGLEAGSKDAAIIGALVALANGLNLRIVVEGVETKQVAALLHQLGRWTTQGYLYGRPAGAHEVTTLLRRQWQTCMPASRFASVE